MKSTEFLSEAKKENAKKQIDQYLSQLSDKDLVSLLPFLKESLSESAKDMMDQKKQGKRVDGMPSDFIAYDDATQTAKRYRERPSGLEVTDAQYRPGPVVQQAAPAAPEVKQMVQNLEKPEAEALADVVAKELSGRRAGQKQSSNTESNPKLLKKVLTALLAGGLLASAYGLGTLSAPDNSAELAKINQLQATIQKYEQSDLPNADAKIKELEKQIQTIQSTLDTTTAEFDKERQDYKSKVFNLEKQAEIEKEKQKARAEIEAEYKARRDAEQDKEKENDELKAEPGNKIVDHALPDGLKLGMSIEEVKKIYPEAKAYTKEDQTIQFLPGDTKLRIGAAPGESGGAGTLIPTKGAYTYFAFDNNDKLVAVHYRYLFASMFKNDGPFADVKKGGGFFGFKVRLAPELFNKVVQNVPKSINVGKPIEEPMFYREGEFGMGIGLGKLIRMGDGLGSVGVNFGLDKVGTGIITAKTTGGEISLVVGTQKGMVDVIKPYEVLISAYNRDNVNEDLNLVKKLAGLA